MGQLRGQLGGCCIILGKQYLMASRTDFQAKLCDVLPRMKEQANMLKVPASVTTRIKT